MLGVAAMKLRATRGDLAAYVMADVKDLVLVENCTAAATAVIRASELRAGDVVIHLSTAYGGSLARFSPEACFRRIHFLTDSFAFSRAASPR